MTTHADLAEVSDQRIVADWALGQWADRLLEQAGLGVTIVDRHGTVMYYNKWASEHLDREPGYLGHSVHERHRRKITNPRFDAMLKLFVDGRIEPVRYVARPYGKTTILVTVSPIRIDGELVGLSQLVLLKDEVQELCARFDDHGPRVVRTRDAAQRLPGRVTVVEVCVHCHSCSFSVRFGASGYAALRVRSPGLSASDAPDKGLYRPYLRTPTRPNRHPPSSTPDPNHPCDMVLTCFSRTSRCRWAGCI